MTTDTTTTTQVHQVYIRATAQAIWDAITSPEWTVKYGYGGYAHWDLRVGGALTINPDEAMIEGSKAMGFPLPDVIIEPVPTRRYPETMAAHLFGYVGEVSDSQLTDGDGLKSGDVILSVGGRESKNTIDAGRLIRMPINDVRVAGRSTQGVTLFATGEDEHVTSVAHLPSEDEDGEGNTDADAAASDAGAAE